MKYVTFATNERTGKTIELETFASAEEAWWNIENNLEWDEDDVREEWTFQDVETSNKDYEPDVEMDFDLYMGCYTDDC